MSTAVEIVGHDPQGYEWLEIRDNMGRVFRYVETQEHATSSFVITWEESGTITLITTPDGTHALLQAESGLPRDIAIERYTSDDRGVSRSGWSSARLYSLSQ